MRQRSATILNAGVEPFAIGRPRERLAQPEQRGQAREDVPGKRGVRNATTILIITEGLKQGPPIVSGVRPEGRAAGVGEREKERS